MRFFFLQKKHKNRNEPTKIKTKKIRERRNIFFINLGMCACTLGGKKELRKKGKKMKNEMNKMMTKKERYRSIR